MADKKKSRKKASTPFLELRDEVDRLRAKQSGAKKKG